MQVTIRGEVFETVRDAANAFGVTMRYIRRAVMDGQQDRIGLRRAGQKDKWRVTPPAYTPMPIRIRGVIYKDAKEAAAALGVTRDAIYWALRCGDPDKIGLPRTYRSGPGSNAAAAASVRKPVQVAGVWFASRRELAKTVGMDASSVGYALKAGPRARANLEKRVRQAVGMF